MPKVTNMKTIPFSNVREYYERTTPTGHWFSRGAMKFFGTRLPSVAYETPAGVLFITSERRTDEERRYYNVRRQAVSGVIDTVGQLNDYRTRAEAMNALRNIASGVQA
jgi:hypothetical protein